MIAETPAARPNRSRVAPLVILLVLGLGIALLSFLTGVLILLAGWGGAALSVGPWSLIAVVAIGFLVGIALIVQSIGGLVGGRSGPFRLGPTWVWFFLFVAVVAAGRSLDHAPLALAVTLEILGGLLPGVTILAYAARRLAGTRSPTSWRQMLAQAGSGLVAFAGWSLALEIVVLVALALAVAGIAAATTSGAQELQQWIDRLRDPAALQSAGTLRDLFRIPLIAGMVFAFVTAAVPVVEETGKALGVLFMGALRRPSLAQAVLWGLAAGTVFASQEGILVLSSSLLKMGGRATFASLAVARAGTTIIHCAATSLSAYGIWRAFAQRRAVSAVPYVILGMLLHAVWNALAVMAAFGTIYWEAAFGAWLGAAVNAAIVAVELGGVGIVALLVRLARRAEPLTPTLAGPPAPSLETR